MHICFPMKIRKAKDETDDIDTDQITISNLFAHFIKEISVEKYGNDPPLLKKFKKLCYEAISLL